jgi:hypothetical protein
MKIAFLPVFNSTSAMHRVFGDAQQLTEIHSQENVLGPVLMTGVAPDGVVTVRVRSWFWKPTYAPIGTIARRFECYFNGVLVDYTCERNLIVKTLRWLTEKGQIHLNTNRK